MTIRAGTGSSQIRRLRRLLSPIPWRIVRKERLYLPTHDRYLLEQIIFPVLLSRAEVHDILFVGCERYTATYPRVFAERHFVTIDSDPTKARYGAAHHVIDTVANLRQHLAPGSLDAVILNGVIGWGLDRPEEINQAVHQCFSRLRAGGLFIVGWNDMPPWRPRPFEEIEGFRAFTPMTLPPFPGPMYPTLGPLRHVFSFYARPRNEGQRRPR